MTDRVNKIKEAPPGCSPKGSTKCTSAIPDALNYLSSLELPEGKRFFINTALNEFI